MDSRGRLILVVIFLLGLFSFRLWQTTGCRQFKSFYLNPQSVTIKVEGDVGTDMGVDRNISRFFHNKYQTRFVLTAQSLTSIFDAPFIFDILGPLGIVAFATSLYTIAKTKKLIGIAHLLLVLAAALTAIFTTKTKQSFYLYAVSLYSFCFWATKPMAKSTIPVLIAAIATFWYFSLSWQLESFCHDIFFN